MKVDVPKGYKNPSSKNESLEQRRKVAKLLKEKNKKNKDK